LVVEAKLVINVGTGTLAMHKFGKVSYKYRYNGEVFSDDTRP